MGRRRKRRITWGILTGALCVIYWQYSNEGRVSGVDGVVDLNIRMRKK